MNLVKPEKKGTRMETKGSSALWKPGLKSRGLVGSLCYRPSGEGLGSKPLKLP